MKGIDKLRELMGGAMSDILNERRERPHSELLLFEDGELPQVFESPTLFEMAPAGWRDEGEPPKESVVVTLEAELPPYWLSLTAIRIRTRNREDFQWRARK